MKTAVVYSVISDESDIFLEQTMISMYSLRLYNPNATIILVVDSQTYSTFNCCRSQVLEYISEVKIVDVPIELSKKQKSRFIKTNLRQYIVGDFLFIDSDTIITDSLEEIDTFNYSIAAVKDRHLNLGMHRYKDDICKCARIINWDINIEENYYNSGVFYVKDTDFVHNFYRLWHDIWLEGHEKGLDIDQPSLGKTNFLLGNVIQELDGIWNCQILANGISYLGCAKILHYFNSNLSDNSFYPFLFSDTSIFKDVKINGGITNELKCKIAKAKSQFAGNCEIIGGKQLIFQQTAVYTVLWRMYLKSNFIFRLLNCIASLILKAYHKFIVVR